MTKLEEIQGILNVARDDKWGALSQAALNDEIAASRARNNPLPVKRRLLGDGTWGWMARIDGEDVVVDDCRMTCFGGTDDPQDSGETASGISTKHRPDLAACSLPMDGRAFLGLSRAEHAALDGSPIPRVPFHTMVRVTFFARPNKDDGKTIELPVIDLGPGKRTGNALDLTIAAARLWAPKATARSFEARGSYRVLGAAKYVK